jgi:hypothetical protein
VRIDCRRVSITKTRGLASYHEELLEQFQPDPQHHPAQLALKKKLQRLWGKYGTNLLHCYDIPGLPPDNLKMKNEVLVSLDEMSVNFR